MDQPYGMAAYDTVESAALTEKNLSDDKTGKMEWSHSKVYGHWTLCRSIGVYAAFVAQTEKHNAFP